MGIYGNSQFSFIKRNRSVKNMLCVKTKLKESRIDGIGLFADQDISKSSAIWLSNDKLSYNEYTKEEWNDLKRNLNPESFEQIKKYSYILKGENTYNVDLDDARFINHSDDPNTLIIGGNLIAIKDIGCGEEITMDYISAYDE